MRILAFCLVLLAGCAGFAGTARAADKFALLVGNSQYSYSPLRNPENDAQDLAALLQGMGFKVTLLKNGSRAATMEALEKYTAQLTPQSLSLFFFAGHGVQVGGRNFLLPIGSLPPRSSELPRYAISLDGVIEALGAAKPRFNLVLLDACRDNPFSDGLLPGLASLDAPPNTLVAFATSPGKRASDGSGRNGLYTQHVLRHLATADLRIEEAFKRVRIGVLEDSGGRQLPWENTALTAELGLASFPDALSSQQAAQVEPPWIAGATEEDLRKYLAENRDNTLRKPVLRQLVQRRASSPVRQGALSLGEVPCADCPRITPMELPGEAIAAGMHLVTVAQFRRCIAARACAAPPDMALSTDEEPAQGLSALDAAAYIAWLNQQPGLAWQYFLPTRDQWQRAFRASYIGSDGKPVYAQLSACRIGNLYDQNGGMAHGFPWTALPCTDGFHEASPVGMFLPSPQGLFDLVGNVWQWTASCAEDKAGPCTQQQLMGGSWATGRSWSWEQPPQLVADSDLQAPIFGLRVFARRR